jgi:hypothetical protein
MEFWNNESENRKGIDKSIFEFGLVRQEWIADFGLSIH